MTQEEGTEIGEEIEEIEEIDTTSRTAELLKNPHLVAAIQAKVNGLVEGPIDITETLPECIKKRLNALKNIQVECAQLEGNFYEEAHALEMKYAGLFKPWYDKRKDIVNASYEPTEEESTWVEPGNDDDDDEDGDGDGKKDGGEHEQQTKQKLEEISEDEKMVESVFNRLRLDESTKGIPEFWLTAMKNVELIEERIKEHDEEVLRNLTDINLILTGKNGDAEDGEMGFELEFHFSPNDYFTNKTLTKSYRMKSVPDKDDPFSFDGPDIFACTGCQIQWKKGKNITQKQVKKKQKSKGRGQAQIVTKMVQNDSFFNFFNPPEVPEDDDEFDEETEDILADDFELGHFFRERLIPKAVLFYTGEAIEEETDDEDEDEDTSSGDDEEEEDDQDGDDDDDDEEKKSGKKPNQEECKQQ